MKYLDTLLTTASDAEMNNLKKAQQRKPRARVTTERFETLVAKIYEAALDDGLWPSALEEVVKFIGNSGTHLFLLEKSTGLVTHDAYFGMPEVLMSEYNTGHILQCPRVKSAEEHPERTILWDYQHIDDRGIDRSDYYQWLKTQGDGIRYYLGARLSLLNDAQGYLSLAFRKSEGHAQGQHIELLQSFIPHINRAIKIGQRLGTWKLSSSAYAEALDNLKHGIVVLDDRGHVLHVNKTASEFTKNSHCIRIYADGIRLNDGSADRLFQQYFATCKMIAERRSGTVPNSLIVRSSPSDRYRITLAPLLFAQRALGATCPRVIVTIERVVDSRSGVTTHPGAIDNLSVAEAKLARLLVQGKGLAAAAQELSLSVHTVRAQLKSIFSKTGTHRQAELVALLLLDK